MGKVVLGCVLALAVIRSSAVVAQAAATSQTGTSPSSAPALSNTVSGAQIVQTALKYLGYPYTTVGHSPAEGFSCIGFVSYVYQVNGIPLPDDLGMARAYAAPVAFSSLLPGDILFFQNTVWTGLSHTAIYIGGGKFIHAEWYNRGVVVSSFNDDPTDGNYWIGKYLSANRPWEGPPGVALVPSSPSSPAPDALPRPTAMLSGPPAFVSVPGLNVRSGPAKTYTIEAVLKKGTRVTVVSGSSGWDRIQLADGTIGWVVAWALSGGTGTTPAKSSPPPAPPRYADTVVPAIILNLRDGPALSANIITVLKQGQRVHVLGVGATWVNVQVPNGPAGWVYRPYLGPVHTIVQTTSGAATTTGTITAPLRVHSAPALTAPVITVAPAGTQITVLAKQGTWYKVRLPKGTAGYVAGQYVK